MQGFASGLKIGKDRIELTHLQFVDDTLLFISHETEQLLNFRLLKCFSIMTGLSINFHKSSLVGWGTNSEWIAQMSKIIGCKSESVPLKYLGLPLGVNCNQAKHWKPVILKIEQRLAMWKSKLLSMAGRA